MVVQGHGDINGPLQKQQDIKYEFIMDITNIADEFLKQEIPYKEIRDFEKTIPEKSLWRYIAVDRKWGYQFSKCAIPVILYSKKEINHENVLKIAGGYIVFYQKLLSEFKADVVIFKLGSHALNTPILEQVCKNLNIIHISPVETRIQNYFSLTPVKEYAFPQVDKTYKKIIKGELNIDPAPGLKCYDEMVSSLTRPDKTYYFDQGQLYTDRIINILKKYSFLSFSIRSLLDVTFAWLNMKKLENCKFKNDKKHKKIRSNFKIKDLFFSYYYYLYKGYITSAFKKKSFYDDFNPNEKYIYFPLNMQPEYTIQVQANLWINQLNTLEIIAKSVPFDWKIYVKEHPSQVLHRVRHMSFYKEIKSYSNVKFIPVYISSHEVIRHAQLILTATGTSGWEAILFHNKPVINLAESTYEVTGLAPRISNIFDLPKMIIAECERINNMPREENKRRLVAYINSVIMHSCWIDNPKVVNGENFCSFEEGRKIGIPLGNLIKDYIDNKAL